MESRVVFVPGISCGHCVAAIIRELKSLPGVLEVTGDAADRRVTVSWESPAQWGGLEAVLAEIGYPPEESWLGRSPASDEEP